MTVYIIIAQVFGLIAMAIEVYALSQPCDKFIKKSFSISGIIFSVHYFLLGAFPAMASEIINIFRFYFSINPPLQIKKYLSVSFIACYIMAGAFFTNSLIEWTAVLPSILATYAVYHTSGIAMRLLFLIAQALWLTYCLYIFSWGGIILYAISGASTIWGIAKLYQKRCKTK